MSQPIATLCPRIDTPCQQLPNFEWGQKRAFCDLCGKHVHNLSAMTRREQDQLFVSQANPCIRYARLIPATVMLIATSGSILAQESAEQTEDLGEIVVTGGGIRGPGLETIFLQSELDVDTSLDDANTVESNEKH